MFRKVAALSIAGFLAHAVPAQAAEVISNGNFSSGLTGWASYTTANGTIALTPSSPGFPQPQTAAVTSFDVAGSGASNALTLNAGKINPPYNLRPQRAVALRRRSRPMAVSPRSPPTSRPSIPAPAALSAASG